MERGDRLPLAQVRSGRRNTECLSADMIKKELCVHLLAYNLTRLLMSEAAALCHREPRSISFRHTVQLWSAWSQCGQQLDAQGWVFLLQAVAGRRVRIPVIVNTYSGRT